MPFIVRDGVGSLVGEGAASGATDGTISYFDFTKNATATLDPAELPLGWTILMDTSLATRYPAGAGYSVLSGENAISLSSPTQLQFSRMEWKFKFSHTWEGEPLGSGPGFTYEEYEYSIDQTFSLAYASTGYRLQTPAQKARGWVQKTGSGNAEGLSFHASIDGEQWEIEMQGYGRALFKAGTSGDTNVRLTPGRWYYVTMELGEDATSYILASIEDGALAQHSGAPILTKAVSALGGSGLRYGDDPLSIDMEYIGLFGGPFAASEAAFYFGGAVFGSTFEGMPTMWPGVYGADNGWVSRLYLDGTRWSRFTNPEGWSEVRGMTADSTGVYVSVIGGAGAWVSGNPHNYVNSGIEKWSPDGVRLWKWTREDAEIEGLPLKGTQLFCQPGSSVVALDTSTGELLWEYDFGSGYAWSCQAGPGTSVWAMWNDDNVYLIEDGTIRKTITVPHVYINNWWYPTSDPEVMLFTHQISDDPAPSVFGLYRCDLRGSEAVIALLGELNAPKPGFPPWYPVFSVDTSNDDVYGYGGYAYLYGDPPFENRWVAKWDKNGVEQWRRAPRTENDYANGNLRLSGSGYTIVAGIDDSIDYYPPVAEIYDTDGNFVVRHQMATDQDGHSVDAAAVAPALSGAETVIDVAPGAVSPGWNTQYCLVEGSRFELDATPTPGSLNVYDYESGDLLDYPEDYVEDDEDGITYLMKKAGISAVTAVFHVPDPALGQHIPVSRPTEEALGQNRERGPGTTGLN